MGRRVIYPLIIWSTQLFSFSKFVQYLLEIYGQNFCDWIRIIHALIKFYLFVNFVIVTLIDPGIIPQHRWPKSTANRMPKPIKIQINDVDRFELSWCSVCELHQPPRSVHCIKCNYCIAEFDHHCDWLNHCIGQRNYRFFFAFITLQTFDLIFMVNICIDEINATENSVRDLSVLIVIGLLLLVLLPVLSLTTFHTIILLKGKTTHEFISGLEVKLTRNWSHVLFGALYPSLANRRRWHWWWHGMKFPKLNSKFINLSAMWDLWHIQYERQRNYFPLFKFKLGRQLLLCYGYDAIYETTTETEFGWDWWISTIDEIIWRWTSEVVNECGPL